jgi:hypothetical protein
VRRLQQSLVPTPIVTAVTYVTHTDGRVTLQGDALKNPVFVEKMVGLLKTLR